MITYKIYSNIGNREVNEDSVGEQQKDENYLFILADGLGGHGHGECASNLAVTTSSSLLTWALRPWTPPVMWATSSSVR